jgi:hypothetical protein
MVRFMGGLEQIQIQRAMSLKQILLVVLGETGCRTGINVCSTRGCWFNVFEILVVALPRSLDVTAS